MVHTNFMSSRSLSPIPDSGLDTEADEAAKPTPQPRGEEAADDELCEPVAETEAEADADADVEIELCSAGVMLIAVAVHDVVAVAAAAATAAAAANDTADAFR